GVAPSPFVVCLLPLLLNPRPALDQVASVGDHLIGNLEIFVRVEAQYLLGSGNFLVTQRSAVRLPSALEVGSRPADDRMQADEARPIRYSLGRLDCVSQRSDIFLVVMSVTMGPVDCLHVPAVGGIASGRVLGERDLGVVLDGDPVAVVDEGEIAESLRGGQRRCLGGDALLDIAIGGK